MKVARRRRKSVLVNTALAAALLAGAGIAYAAVEDDGGKAPVSSRTRTTKVAKGTVMASVSASGSLSSPSDAGVSFTASGTVTKVAVKVGDKVTAGQVLAEIDPTAAQEDVDEAEAALDVAEENLAKAKKGTTVTIPPTAGSGTSGGGTTGAGSGAGAGSGSGSGANTGTGAGTTAGTPAASGKPSSTATTSAASVSPTKAAATPTPSTSTTVDAAQVAQAESALVQAQNKLAEAKRVLAGCVLKAPTDGLVASVAGKVGDTASAGSSGASTGSSTGAGAGGSSGGTSGGGTSSGSSSTGFVVIANPSGMEIDVSFSEADAAKVKAGQPATVTMNVDSATKRNAKVVSVNPLPDSGATSGSVKYTATIALEGDVGTLRTGQTANVQVIVAQADNALYVPSAAVTGTGTAASVTVVANGAQERRTVSLGVVGDQTTQIVSGLAEGDEVVVGTVATGNSSTGNGTTRGATGGTGGAGGTSGVVPGNLGGGSAGGGPVGGFPPGGAGGR